MTNTIKTIIVDDEINSIHNLEEDLKAYPEIEILDTITSSQKAKKSIIQYQPDLLFLDVEMPYINGIELLQEIRPYVRNNMRVIFYSAFDKYMLDALRASAFDYLLKPYQTNELKHRPTHKGSMGEKSITTQRGSIDHYTEVIIVP